MDIWSSVQYWTIFIFICTWVIGGKYNSSIVQYLYSLGSGLLLTGVDVNSPVCKLFKLQTEVAVQTISFAPCPGTTLFVYVCVNTCL